MKRLKELREAAGLSQVALAARAGISQKRVSDMECGVYGRKRSLLDTLDRILKALGCTYEELTGTKTRR